MMNLLTRLLPLLLVFFFTSCGGDTAQEGNSSNTQLLEEAFAPASYAHLLDSAKGSGEITAQEHDLVLGFIRAHATSIPKGHTLGSLLEGAQGHQRMMGQDIQVKVQKGRITTDRKIYGFHLDLVAHNQSETGVERLRGYLEWKGPEGQSLKNSPLFSMRGKLAPGDSLDKVLLQTAYYRPTGNELNDPKNKAWRDTLKMMEKTVGNFDQERFVFHLSDLRLSNGLTPAQYWLKPPADREALKGATADKAKIAGLQGWPKKNSEWMEKLTAGLGNHYLEITPILTNKGERTHGEYLVFDRINKVRRFFLTQANVPARRINPGGVSGDLVHFEEVDYWKWPMELRIYASEID